MYSVTLNLRLNAICVAVFFCVALIFGRAQAATNYCEDTATYCSAAPVCPNVGGGVDFAGQTIQNVNFGDKGPGYLLGADFSGTTLIGVNFGNQDLTGATFKGAVFKANSDGTRTDLSNSTLKGTCFTGADLSGADLQFATFEGTDFTCANAINAKFGPVLSVSGGASGRTNFAYAKLGIAEDASSFLFPLNNMTPNPSFWQNTAFECTKLIGLAPSNFAPAGHDMSDAVLKGMVFDGFSFYDAGRKVGSILNGADLSGSSLRSSDLSLVKLDGVTMVGADASGANFTEASFYSQTASNLKLAKFNNANLNNTVFDHSSLQTAQFHNSVGTSTSFKNANFQPDANNKGASIIGASFIKADFESAALNNVSFTNNTDLSGSSFRNTTLSGTSFSFSDLTSAVFDGATLQDVDFTNAALNSASFASTNLTAAKTGEGVNFLCAQLGGTTFSSAVLSKANFQAAVMPPDSQCCPQADQTYFCGYDKDGIAYGHTVLPTVPDGASVTCPNGDTLSCTGSDWLVPNWTSNLCNPNGRSEVLWTKPTCGKQPKTVIIPDANLKKCLQDTIYNGANRPITVTAAKALQNLSCGERQISDLAGLEKKNFPNLVTLDLTGNQLAGAGDFTGFSDQLEEVKLGYNNYTSLTFSNDQTELNYLAASNNQLTAVTVSPNSYLTYLDLAHNQLGGTVDFFATRENNLSFLDLSFNSITSIGDADLLTDANTIYLQSNRLTTIGSVSSLWSNGSGSLFYLKLNGNACFQCGTLEVEKSVSDQFGCSCDPNTCGDCK
ncbi:pentapeptide repeat-containing protein [Phycobacter sp. K97]|uniref:pentapeptide repeat-containing protein n=1 Tax=Phycobacter sedimenti TaxID=3133977 RepID=UPI00311EF92E